MKVGWPKGGGIFLISWYFRALRQLLRQKVWLSSSIVDPCSYTEKHDFILPLADMLQ